MFCQSVPKIGILLILSHQTAIVLALVIFLFDSLREKRSVPLTKESGIACFKNCCGIFHLRQSKEIPFKVRGRRPR